MLRFADTHQSSLDRIMQIEQADRGWICPYTRARHMQCIEDPSERHVSVFREAGDELVGFIILQQVQNPHRSLEFRRLVIGEKGRGYGRASLRWIKSFCFEELEFHRLWFDVFTFNERAINLYESEGFRREGLLRECLLVDGEYKSLYLYSMLDREYFGR